MSDYISREAAIEAFEKELSAKYNRIELSIGFVGAKSILSDLPAADVVERNTGKWMHDKDDTLYSGYCSCCGWESVIGETDVADMSYCPNCGARMER